MRMLLPELNSIKIMRLSYSVLLISVMFACSVEPKPILYGSDGCHFCKMTIVDRQHAAQIVTNKGKVFNYDAIECMLNDLDSKDEQKIALILVNDYDAPGQLTDARDASYLISKAIPSPMGAFLTGFSIKYGTPSSS